MTEYALPCTWASYPWKNELSEQARRVETHLEEALDDDFRGEHDPLAMLERSLVLAAFAIRRMCEKRLISDSLASTARSVDAFLATERYRAPFMSRGGGPGLFDSFDFAVAVLVLMNVGELANEVVHSSHLAVFADDVGPLGNGILVASDWHQSKRLLHLSRAGFDGWVTSVLDDRVLVASDTWDPASNKVRARREP